MSKSWKSISISTLNAGCMKWWKIHGSRVMRHRCKQLINTCEDWETLMLPVKDEILDEYDFDYYRVREYVKPDDLDCYRDNLKAWRIDGRGDVYNHYPLDETGHHKYCDCGSNPQSRYWKGKRK